MTQFLKKIAGVVAGSAIIVSTIFIPQWAMADDDHNSGAWTWHSASASAESEHESESESENNDDDRVSPTGTPSTSTPAPTITPTSPTPSNSTSTPAPTTSAPDPTITTSTPAPTTSAPDPTITTSTPAPTTSTPTPSHSTASPTPSETRLPSATPTPSGTSSSPSVTRENNPGGRSNWPTLTLIPVQSAPPSGRATVDGREIPTILRPNTRRSGLEFVAQGWQVNLGALTRQGSVVDLSADGSLAVQRDHSLTADGSGFAPKSTVDVYIYSNPIKLGTVTTDANGEFVSEFPVPDELENGLHTLQVIGYSPSGLIQEGEIPVTLYEAASVVKPSTVTKSIVVYFKPGTHQALKRSKPALKKLIKLARASSVHPVFTITSYNSRKDIRPSRNLAIRRLRVLNRVLRPLNPSTPVTTAFAPMRRHHWGYVRVTVKFTQP